MLTGKQKNLLRKLRNARKNRKQRRRPTGMKGLTKTYSYVFKPETQWIHSNTVAGEIVIRPPTAPLNTGTSISSINVGRIGFPNYYDFGVGMRFQLRDCANHLAYTGIYDQYRINSITVKCTYLATQAQIQGTSVLPTMYYVGDFDDITAPLSISDVEGKQGSKALRVSNTRNTFTFNIKPKLAVNVVGGQDIGNSYNRITNSGWLDCADPDVYHYAGKWWFTNVYLPAGSSTNTAIQFEYVYNISFRGAQNLY